jgi:hypothetical protein
LAVLIFCVFGSSPADKKKPDMPCSLFYFILFGSGLQCQQGTMVIYQGMIGGAQKKQSYRQKSAFKDKNFLFGICSKFLTIFPKYTPLKS